MRVAAAYLWRFGDSFSLLTTSAAANPTPTCTRTGQFTVSLQITDGAFTAVVSKTRYVAVGEARVIEYEYDNLYRLIEADYSSGEYFAYVHDALGNRTLVTSTTPFSGTVVTTYTYDAANRLTDHVRSDGRSYILRAEPQDKAYTWSNRGQLLAEWAPEIPIAVREFSYDGAGRMTQARVLTLTTRFAYNGDGARRTVEVVGYGHDPSASPRRELGRTLRAGYTRWTMVGAIASWPKRCQPVR